MQRVLRGLEAEYWKYSDRIAQPPDGGEHHPLSTVYVVLRPSLMDASWPLYTFTCCLVNLQDGMTPQ